MSHGHLQAPGSKHYASNTALNFTAFILFWSRKLREKLCFLWGMNQNQSQAFITNLDFLFDNRHQTTCKNTATITNDFSKDKYSLQICEGGKATSSKLQVDQENLLILILEARHVGQGRKQFGFASYDVGLFRSCWTWILKVLHQSVDARPWPSTLTSVCLICIFSSQNWWCSYHSKDEMR